MLQNSPMEPELPNLNIDEVTIPKGSKSSEVKEGDDDFWQIHKHGSVTRGRREEKRLRFILRTGPQVNNMGRKRMQAAFSEEAQHKANSVPCGRG